MIITVTLNPAIDKTIQVEHLTIGALNRIIDVREDAGGKGINVSKTVKSLGGETLATGFLGGNSGEWIAEYLNETGIKNQFAYTGQKTRTNLKVADEDGMITEINEPGPWIAPLELAGFSQKLLDMIHKEDIVILSGSVPKGVPKDYYAQLIPEIHARGAKVFLDADGTLFATAIEEKPDIVKPNLTELERYCTENGISVDMSRILECPKAAEWESDTVKRAVYMGLLLKEKGIGEVLVSLGSEGAVFLIEDQIYYTPALDVEVHSTVGAGDAMVAAYAFAKNRGLLLEDRIRFCVAVSAGAVTTTGTRPADREVVERLQEKVKIHVCLVA